MSQTLATLIPHIRIVQDDLAGFLSALTQDAAQAPVRLGFVNAHAVNLAHRDEGFAADLGACEWLVRDGSGMKILYRLLGRPAGLNLNGTDLIPHILPCYAGQTALLLGTQEPWLTEAARLIGDHGIQVVGKIDGFQDDEFYSEMAAATRPQLIILAMGMPKQERIAAKLHRLFSAPAGPSGLSGIDAPNTQKGGQEPYPCLIVCGGAILDFIGGKVTRAPSLWRKTGMEWLYRLCNEPRRLFGRYVIGNGVFLIRAALVAARMRGKNT